MRGIGRGEQTFEIRSPHNLFVRVRMHRTHCLVRMVSYGLVSSCVHWFVYAHSHAQRQTHTLTHTDKHTRKEEREGLEIVLSILSTYFTSTSPNSALPYRPTHPPKDRQIEQENTL